MNEKMTWVSPMTAVQHFVANDHVAACDPTLYSFVCEITDIWWRGQEVDLWKYNPGVADGDNWKDSMVGNANNSINLTEGDAVFTADSDHTWSTNDLGSISRGWIDNNPDDTAKSIDIFGFEIPYLPAESFQENVWIWQDANEAYHASKSMSVTSHNFSA